MLTQYTYYCQPCDPSGSITMPSNNPLGHKNQRRKYKKHTQLPNQVNSPTPVSVFTDRLASSYVHQVEDGYKNAIVEYDDQNRRNLVSKDPNHNPIGQTIMNGVVISMDDGLKIVQPDLANKYHAFTTGSLSNKTCAACGTVHW
ncbi:hypothetical protein GCM10028806_34580 [Spirosoma terrae]